MENTATTVHRRPSLGLAVIPFITLIATMLPTVIILGADPQIPLIISSIVTSFIGIKFLGYKWSEIEDAMVQANSTTMQANFIIMIVGCLIAVWIAGGIVPSLIFYGLKLFTPRSFLIVLPLVCAVVAISTGSSWSTAGTMGVAAMGIASGLGIPLPLAAGAVITGAQFGDKLSPLSDTTNLAPAVSGANVFDHIKSLLWTTLPSFALAIAIFAWMGSGYTADQMNTEQIDGIIRGLEANFQITPWALLAPLSVIAIILLKIPAVPGMILATLIGCLFAAAQGVGLADMLIMMINGFEMQSGNEMLDTLLNRGGMQSMMYTISLVICALAFGGAVQKIGCLDTFLGSILHFFRSRGAVITSNLIACYAMNVFAADQYMSIVIPGQMYRKLYQKLNIHPSVASRILEDSGTLTSGTVPWSTCGAVYFACLGVSAWEYAPYCLMAIITPVLSAFYGFTGLTIAPLDPSQPVLSHISPEDYVADEETKPLGS
ncbi:MAG: Na+/H+ antiporter NhaC [Bacteroidetes bacterium]|nr:MAG: Na+/H+ antiporter NhaC [Bacteroidota bacterium]